MQRAAAPFSHSRHGAFVGFLLGAIVACHPEPKGAPANGLDTSGATANQLDPRSDLKRQPPPADPYVLSPVDTLGDTTSWGAPNRMELVGDYLVIADDYATYQIVVLDTRTGETRGAFGRKGGGPKELPEPDLLFVESITPPRLWVWDSGAHRFSLWEIERPGPLLEPVRSFRIDARAGYQEAFLVSDGMIFTRKYDENALLYLADSAGVVRRTVGEFPYPRTWDQVVNYPIPIADPARRRVALSFGRTNRVDFYEVTGRHIATGTAPVDVPPLRVKRVGGEQRFERPLPVTFGRGSATSRFVYLRYCTGCTTADPPLEYRHVQVFDWTGAFVMTLDLGAPSWAIEVDENNEVLYAAIEDPAPVIVKYRLPPTLRTWGRP